MSEVQTQCRDGLYNNIHYTYRNIHGKFGETERDRSIKRIIYEKFKYNVCESTTLGNYLPTLQSQIRDARLACGNQRLVQRGKKLQTHLSLSRKEKTYFDLHQIFYKTYYSEFGLGVWSQNLVSEFGLTDWDASLLEFSHFRFGCIHSFAASLESSILIQIMLLFFLKV